MQVCLDEQEVDALIDRVDGDGNCELDFFEFAKLMAVSHTSSESAFAKVQPLTEDQVMLHTNPHSEITCSCECGWICS